MVMRTKNVIESLTIEIRIELQPHANSSQGDDWSRLDEVLTTPGWFSLRRVSLAIEIISYHWNDELEEPLRKLPETQITRLSTSNSIAFDFEVNTEWE